MTMRVQRSVSFVSRPYYPLVRVLHDAAKAVPTSVSIRWRLLAHNPLNKAIRTTPGKAQAPPAAAGAYQKVTYLPGGYEIPVASLEHHAGAVRATISATAGAHPDAVLYPEPSNAFDRHAVAVHMTGGKVGYIPRTLAAALQPAITAAASTGRPVACPARIITGPGSPKIVLRIQIAGLGIDPASLR